MKELYKKELPEWYASNDKYDLILTDDIDSLLSCAILKKVKNWNIEQVFLFKANKEQNIDYLGKTSNATHEAVGVDLALQHGKCFDNHLSRLVESDHINQECINPNRFKTITRSNYTSKYNLSTVLLLMSLYDIPLPDSEEGKMILLTIDGSYMSYFSDYFRPMNKYWLCDVLDLNGLYECLQRHKQYEFKDIEKKFNLNKKIISSKGKLHTDIDLVGVNMQVGLDLDIWCDLPKERFTLVKKYQDIQIPLTKNKTIKLADITQNPYSVALTRKDFINYSTESEE